MSDAIWSEPGMDYYRRALEDLGLKESDVEEVEESQQTPQGKYPTLDRVMKRAWELREAEEAE